MSQTNLVKEIRDSAEEILKVFGRLISNNKERDFNDINKRARENELTLYSLVSDNVPDEYYDRIAKGIEHQILASIQSILSITVKQDPQAAIRFVLNNFTNNSDLLSKFKNNVTNINDTLGELADVDLVDLKIIFNENSAAKSNIANNRHPSHTSSDNTESTQPEKVDINALGSRFSSDIELDKKDKSALRIPGHLHTVNIKYTSFNNEVLDLTLTVFIRVRLIPVESNQVIEAVVSAKNRDNFFNYIKWRAGKQPFFRGFLLNLAEIKRQVKRDTSSDLNERILGSLLSRGGFTRPKALSETTELKNFILVLSNAEVERLQNSHNVDILKSTTLRHIFNNMNIMTLMIVDEYKKRVIIFESDKPTEMNVITLADMNDAMRLAKLFQNINK